MGSGYMTRLGRLSLSILRDFHAVREASGRHKSLEHMSLGIPTVISLKAARACDRRNQYRCRKHTREAVWTLLSSQKEHLWHRVWSRCRQSLWKRIIRGHHTLYNLTRRAVIRIWFRLADMLLDVIADHVCAEGVAFLNARGRGRRDPYRFRGDLGHCSAALAAKCDREGPDLLGSCQRVAYVLAIA